MTRAIDDLPGYRRRIRIEQRAGVALAMLPVNPGPTAAATPPAASADDVAAAVPPCTTPDLTRDCKSSQLLSSQAAALAAGSAAPGVPGAPGTGGSVVYTGGTGAPGGGGSTPPVVGVSVASD